MAIENGINWAKLVTSDDIVIPTYGLYGGPDYTGGRIDPAVFINVDPLDPLDRAFKAHDLAYFNIPAADTQGLAVADLNLIGEIMALPNSQLGGEAHLYAGATELVLLYNIIVTYGEGDLLTPQQVNAILADAIDNLQRGTIDPENAAERAGANLVLSQVPLLDAVGFLDDIAAPGSVVFASPGFVAPSDALFAATQRPGITLQPSVTLQDDSFALLVRGDQANSIFSGDGFRANLDGVRFGAGESGATLLTIGSDFDLF